jgi:hypothetical protein
MAARRSKVGINLLQDILTAKKMQVPLDRNCMTRQGHGPGFLLQSQSIVVLRKVGHLQLPTTDQSHLSDMLYQGLDLLLGVVADTVKLFLGWIIICICSLATSASVFEDGNVTKILCPKYPNNVQPEHEDLSVNLENLRFELGNIRNRCEDFVELLQLIANRPQHAVNSLFRTARFEG